MYYNYYFEEAVYRNSVARKSYILFRIKSIEEIFIERIKEDLNSILDLEYGKDWDWMTPEPPENAELIEVYTEKAALALIKASEMDDADKLKSLLSTVNFFHSMVTENAWLTSPKDAFDLIMEMCNLKPVKASKAVLTKDDLSCTYSLVGLSWMGFLEAYAIFDVSSRNSYSACRSEIEKDMMKLNVLRDSYLIKINYEVTIEFSDVNDALKLAALVMSESDYKRLEEPIMGFFDYCSQANTTFVS